MRIIHDDGLHDRLVTYYQSLEVVRLNRVLQACGVSDVQKRREICENYFFDSGSFLDSGWFAHQSSRFHPGVYFSELGAASEATNVYLPDPLFRTAFHEYAFGAADWFFDDHKADEDDIGIETGIIDI